MEHGNRTSLKEFIFMAMSVSTKYQALVFTVFLLLYLIILLGNTLMLLIIKNDSYLHTPMYFFVFSLSCLDICYSSTIVPQTLANIVSHRHSISFLGCATQMFCVIAFGAFQIFLITAMAYDRYVAISNPLRYKTMMSWKICINILFIVLICSFVIAFLIIFSVFELPFCRLYKIQHFFCDVGQVLLLTCPNIQIHNLVEIVTFTLGLSIFTIPFILIVISYIYIISAIMKIRTNQGRRKAFSTCSSHLTVVVVEYACLGFMYLKPKEAYALDNNKVFVAVFTFGTPILNPLVYTVRNKAVKKGFKKLIERRLE